MKLYAIAPKNGVEVIRSHPRHLVIAQWLTDDAYRVFYKGLVALGHELILDNGAYEFGEAMESEEYWKVISMMRPTIVVAPDSFRNAKKTVERVEKFYEEMHDRCLESKFEVMGVPQGSNLTEWLWCYEKIAPMVNVIGLPTAQWGDRTGIVRHFLAKKLDNLKEPRIHLLGCWNPLEVLMYNDVPRVKSIDTSLPFKYAEKGWLIKKADDWKGFEMPCDSPADWKLDWYAEYTEQGNLTHALRVAKANLETLHRMCEGV
jgi:hypothetical protein